jgi:16S rRNA (guanine527-N7)-methyltransferase
MPRKYEEKMNKEEFKNLLRKEHVEISDAKAEQFETYYETLVSWNEVMNLTAITEHDDVCVKHFADSVALKYAVDKLSEKDEAWGKEFNSLKSIIDVGTGAGFPGIPLKIAFDSYNVTLLDSLNKRVKFLNEVIEKLNISEITAIHSRAEDGARNADLREKFDIGVSRAVANMATLCEYVLPFVRVGGYFVAFKAGNVDEELNSASKAIKVLGGELSKQYAYTLPDTDIERTLIFIKKVSPTPKKYPRKAGLPGKEPIA